MMICCRSCVLCLNPPFSYRFAFVCFQTLIKHLRIALFLCDTPVWDCLWLNISVYVLDRVRIWKHFMAKIPSHKWEIRGVYIGRELGLGFEAQASLEYTNGHWPPPRMGVERLSVSLWFFVVFCNPKLRLCFDFLLGSRIDVGNVIPGLRGVLGGCSNAHIYVWPNMMAVYETTVR